MTASMDKTWENAVLWLREQPDQQDLVRACFFDDPLLDAANRYYASSEWIAVREIIGTGPGTVLDIGAGRGTSSYAFARDGWQVTALEPDPSAIVGAGAIRSLADEASVKIDVVEAWGESLPFPDATFDIVYGRQVLHHAQDLEELCREIGRVMKPGGILLATREHVVFRPRDLERFLGKHPLHRLYGGEHAYRLDEYMQALEHAGLKVERVLNPWASDINLFPKSASDIRAGIGERLPFIPARLITPSILARLGWLWRTPGASYSFVGRKP